MRILLWHGYLLRGSGSNILKANVARAWRRAGHDVLLMCQERNVEGLDFVDHHGDLAPDNRTVATIPTGAAPGPGSITLVRPSIGEILPVYVYDRYDGLTAKRYVDLSDDELHRYVDANVAAMQAAFESFGPDVVFTSHEVMGPYIALQAGQDYVAQLHGSALEYAVKEQTRYLHYASEGLNGAAAVVGGSHYMIEAAGAVVPGWEDRAVVVNPGCDVELFRPESERVNEPPVVGFVGKFIAQKGVHNLLAALTLAGPLRAVIVGFGALDMTLRNLWAALEDHDLDGVSRIAQEAGFDDIRDALDVLAEGRADGIDVTFTGRLDHDRLAPVLPTFDVLVVPSIMSEAFGMVAAEAAACGVLPVVPSHSGIGEVGAALEESFGRPGLLTYHPRRPIAGIAERLRALFALARSDRAELARTAVDLARERWSWDTVARSLLGVATAARS